MAVSGRNLDGVNDLRDAIRRRLGFEGFDPAAPMAFTRRQAELLTAAGEALDRADAPQARSALAELLGGRP